MEVQTVSQERLATKIGTNLPFAFIYLDKPGAIPETAWRETPRALITIRLSEEVAEKMVSHRVEPVNPAIAKAARIQGTVRIFVVIGKDGAIQDLHQRPPAVDPGIA